MLLVWCIAATFGNLPEWPELQAVFDEHEWVQVVVALDDQDWPLRVEDQVARTHAMVDEVLNTDLEFGFRLERRFQSVPAIVGWLSRDAFRRILDTPKNGSSIVGCSLDSDVTAGDWEWEQSANKLGESASLIGATQVHDQGIRGSGVEIAIIDTGFDSDHPDLAHGLVAEACFCESPLGPCCPNGLAAQEGLGSAEDDEGHGTHVSGILTSDGVLASVGIAPESWVTVIKGLDFQGRGRLSNWIAGLDWLHVHRPDLKVVSMSLQSGAMTEVCDGAPAVMRSFHRAAQNLYDRGVLLVGISGNQGYPGIIVAPGCLSNVWAIAASNKMDVPWVGSNSHNEVAFFAPGVGITSSQMGGGRVTATGTSMAAPHVAGAAALLYQANPLLNQEDLRRLFEDSGFWIQDQYGLYKPRIDVWQAFQDIDIGPFERWLPFIADPADYRVRVHLRNSSAIGQVVSFYPLNAIGRALPRERVQLAAFESQVLESSALFSQPPSHLAWVSSGQVKVAVSMENGLQPTIRVGESTSAATVFEPVGWSQAPNAAVLVNVGPTQSKAYVYQVGAGGSVLNSRNYGYVPRFGQLKARLDVDFPPIAGSSFRLVSSQISHAIFLNIP